MSAELTLGTCLQVHDSDAERGSGESTRQRSHGGGELIIARANLVYMIDGCYFESALVFIQLQTRQVYCFTIPFILMFGRIMNYCSKIRFKYFNACTN